VLWAVAIVPFVLWAPGMASGATVGWWIDLLLVLAAVSLVVAVLRGAGHRTRPRRRSPARAPAGQPAAPGYCVEETASPALSSSTETPQ
jgi:hypothetical protein